MLYDLSMSESNKYENLQSSSVSTVYVIQEIAGTRAGNPKINIMGASNYGQFKFLLPEFSQMIFSPGPLIYKLRQGLKNYTSTVYVIQEISGSKAGSPKINIIGASQYGQFKFLLPEFSQMILSPGPLIYKLRQGLKNFKKKDYLLLTGDPAIIGVACSIVSDITGGKYNLLKWDKQERKYYPIEINLYEKGEIDDN